ncbi:MAG: hypothetical protein WCJ35_06835 [Planctomycetota bacterium]
MKRTWIWVIGLAAVLGWVSLQGVFGADKPGIDPPPLPAGWLADWNQPPMTNRPLQIIHGIDPRAALPEGVEQMVAGSSPGRRKSDSMQYYKDCGLGGVVCNVAFHGYMDSEENWKNLLAGVDRCDKLGMVVWLYDEQGYPSGAAGGQVLRENRALEATELAFDASRSDPLLIRAAYEHTHASNNFYAARRYINLLEEQATRAFIKKTHEAYFQRLKPYFGRTVQAMFTDEPSLITVNLGSLSEKVRAKVPVVDPLDPAVQPLPAVPWCSDLPQCYQKRFGEDLLPRRQSLFAGQSPEDRRVRRQFWSLVADLVADRYFGAIQHWCHAHGIASSGHGLWEEVLMHHATLEGNGLKALGRMDIPGMDLLTSNPEQVLRDGWMTAAMPSSAAALHGRRRVMTEVSDFIETLGGHAPASIADMQATAAWQAAWGVTDFMLYYKLAARSPQEYRAYCDYVGRLNAILKPARLDSKVLLYYPIYDLWAEYLPVAGPLQLESQSPRAQRIVASFMQMGQTLQQHQVPFLLIDHENLAAAAVSPDGKLILGEHSFETILLPEGAELEPKSAAVVERFRRQGGGVLACPPDALLAPKRFATAATAQSQYRISPPSSAIALGRFARDGHTILLIVNVGTTAYDGDLQVGDSGTWQMLDPATGTIRMAETKAPGRLQLQLKGRQSVILVL